MALKNRKIVAVDSGAYNTKGKSSVGSVMFRTKYTKRHSDLGMANENTYNVTVNGKEYTVGDSAKYEDVSEGKDSEIHIVSTLTSVALLRGDAKEVILMYGESFNMYSNPEQKAKIKTLLEGKHTVTIESKNGAVETHEFTITLVHILPEGIGHILQDLRNNQGVRYSWDWGGSTVNFLEVINGIPSDNSRSFELGMHNLTGSVQHAISMGGEGRQPEQLVKDYIEKGCPNRNIQNIIDDVLEEQLYKIDHELNKMGINLQKFQEVTFIGGTSQLFSKQIRERYGCAILYPNSITANVDGFYEYGRLKYGSQAS